MCMAQAGRALLPDGFSAYTGVQYREQAGLDKAHPRGDPGEDCAPEGSLDGAHPHPQTCASREAEGKEVSTWQSRESAHLLGRNSCAGNQGTTTTVCLKGFEHLWLRYTTLSRLH